MPQVNFLIKKAGRPLNFPQAAAKQPDEKGLKLALG
jgi:hypothetical protein